MPIPGVIASAIVPSESDYELISTTVLSSDTADITFDNLGNYSSTYKHLQIRYVARSSRSATDDDMKLNFNTNTSNYYRHELYGTGSDVASGSNSEAYFRIGHMTANNSTANAFGAGIIDILDFSSTSKNTTARSLSGGTDLNRIKLTSGGWFNTAAITSIKLGPANGNFKTGSRISLYGIKG